MSFEIGFGPITTQRGARDNRSSVAMYDLALRSATAAEAAGFGSVWVGEHHLTDDGYLPAPLTLLGAIAAATRRVWLGTKVLLPALYHPLRIAEDAAAVQALSNGRLIIGAAIGYREEEFAAFHTQRRERVQRLETMMTQCRAAWSGRPIGEAGSARRLVPVAGHIPIWLGGAAEPALRRAGRLGDGFVAPVGPVDDLVRQVGIVDSAATEARRAVLPVASSSFVVLRHTDVNPHRQDSALGHLLAGYQSLKADDPLSRVGRTWQSRPMVIEGSAAAVITRLLEFRRSLAPDREHHHVVRLDYPGLTEDEVLSSVAAFGRDVLPALHSASAANSGIRTYG